VVLDREVWRGIFLPRIIAFQALLRAATNGTNEVLHPTLYGSPNQSSVFGVSVARER
jgi:hypothetical protein